MRRYRIASWILLSLSIINFTLTAPVAVRDVHTVLVNAADAAKDRTAVLQQRMDPDEDQSSDLTSEHTSEHSSGHATPFSQSSGLTSEHGRPYHSESDSYSELGSEWGWDGGPGSVSVSESGWDGGSEW